MCVNLCLLNLYFISINPRNNCFEEGIFIIPIVKEKLYRIIFGFESNESIFIIVAAAICLKDLRET